MFSFCLWVPLASGYSLNITFVFPNGILFSIDHGNFHDHFNGFNYSTNVREHLIKNGRFHVKTAVLIKQKGCEN